MRLLSCVATIWPTYSSSNSQYTFIPSSKQARMTQIKVNGHSHANGNGHTTDTHSGGAHDRSHPQTSFVETSIDTSSFFGKLRKLYSEKVLKTQLDQLKHQGSYDAFKLEWHPAYDVRRLHGGNTRVSASHALLIVLTLISTGGWDSTKLVLGI